jgi:hypothetical protein
MNGHPEDIDVPGRFIGVLCLQLGQWNVGMVTPQERARARKSDQDYRPSG